MNAGPLNKRITFLSRHSSQDSTGDDKPTWTTVVAQRWASINPLNGKQLALAQANTVTSTATHDIRIRYDPALVGQVDFRISYAAMPESHNPPPVRYFRINSILDSFERHEELRIMATEVTAASVST